MSHENVEIIHAGYQAFIAGDFAQVFALLDPDVTWAAAEHGPWDCESREEVLRVLSERWQEDYRIELEECRPADDSVFVSFRAAGFEEPSRVEDAAGRRFAVDRYFTVGRFYAVVTIRDGRVVHVQDYRRREDALDAVGLADDDLAGPPPDR